MRCVLVVVQYVAKLHKEKLIKAVQGIEAQRGHQFQQVICMIHFINTINMII